MNSRFAKCFVLLLLMQAGCNSSDSSLDSQPTPETIVPSASCQWLTAQVAGQACGPHPWEQLATWRTTEPPVDTSSLNFIQPADPVQAAEFQRESGFQAPGREDLLPWRIDLPIPWNADPYQDRNWRFHLHAWRMLDPLVFAWMQTGDPKYIESALAIIDDWHEFHVERALPSAYGWYDMSTGIRAMKLAFFLDRALRGELELAAPHRDLLLELAELHVSKLLDPGFLSIGNHGHFQLHGLIALCRTVPYLKSCPGALDYAESRWQDLLGRQFSDEGIHLEHSPGYHFFITDTIVQMLRSGWYENFEYVQTLMAQAQKNKIWMVSPDKTYVAVGDSSAVPARLTLPLGDPSCVDLTTYQTRCYLLKAFPKSGYAMVRSDWAIPPTSSSMLFFMAAFHSGIHKHADDLSFELFEFGERLLTDTGESSYELDVWRQFALSTKAHNALEINATSFSTQSADAYGSALRDVELRGGTFVLEGEAAHSSGAVQQRKLFYAPRHWLLVVDRLVGGAVTTATEWFHFAPQVQVTERAPGVDTPTIFDARLGGGRPISIEQMLPGCTGALVKGSIDPIQGWSTKSYGQLEPRFTVSFTCPGDPRAHATLFVLDPERRESALVEADAILRGLGLRP
jgi:hypothetical protein